jgi:hypothetical protein
MVDINIKVLNLTQQSALQYRNYKCIKKNARVFVNIFNFICKKGRACCSGLCAAREIITTHTCETIKQSMLISKTGGDMSGTFHPWMVRWHQVFSTDNLLQWRPVGRLRLM